jgi:hypothetical protein
MQQLLEAFVDESFHENPHGGFCVVAAAVLVVEQHEVREAMLQVRGRRRSSRLRWPCSPRPPTGADRARAR